MHRIALSSLLLFFAVIIAACGGTSRSNSPGPARVDPQIFSDVAAGAFPLPGRSMLRTMRIMLASIELPSAACGGRTDLNLDSTNARFDQARYADLELIARKGLSEKNTLPLMSRASDACTKAKLPSFERWYNLASIWQDATLTAINSPRVGATRERTASCLRRVTGLNVEVADPTASFLRSVDYALSATGNARAIASQQREFSDAYVQCAGQYFAALATELNPVRARLVERNRELLEQYSAELAALGYVP
jgi:hypothetical protein